KAAVVATTTIAREKAKRFMAGHHRPMPLMFSQRRSGEGLQVDHLFPCFRVRQGNVCSALDEPVMVSAANGDAGKPGPELPWAFLHEPADVHQAPDVNDGDVPVDVLHLLDPVRDRAVAIDGFVDHLVPGDDLVPAAPEMAEADGEGCIRMEEFAEGF